MTLSSTGTGGAERGLRVSPWWNNLSNYAVDGRFMINAQTGEISCFGGRLQFYSFVGRGHRLLLRDGRVLLLEPTKTVLRVWSWHPPE